MPDAKPLLRLLLDCATAWAEANASSTARLARQVTGSDGKFFSDLERGRDPGVGKVTDFARFLHAPENWPEGLVPAKVCDLAHRVGVSGEGAALSAGKAGDVSSRERAA